MVSSHTSNGNDLLCVCILRVALTHVLQPFINKFFLQAFNYQTLGSLVSLKTAYAAGTLRIGLGQFMGELLILGVDHSVVSHQWVEYCCCCELRTVVPLFLRTALIPFEQTKGIII